MTWLIMHVAVADQKIGVHLLEQEGANNEG